MLWSGVLWHGVGLAQTVIGFDGGSPRQSPHSPESTTAGALRLPSGTASAATASAIAGAGVGACRWRFVGVCDTHCVRGCLVGARVIGYCLVGAATHIKQELRGEPVVASGIVTFSGVKVTLTSILGVLGNDPPTLLLTYYSVPCGQYSRL